MLRWEAQNSVPKKMVTWPLPSGAQALGIGMRLVRPVDIPSTTEEKSQWWKADIESIEFDVNDRVSQGRGARGIADKSLPKEAKELGFAE